VIQDELTMFTGAANKPAASSTVVLQQKETPDIPDDEHRERGEAADRLWKEIKRRVAEQRGRRARGFPSG
jgi:hypothetical protein